MTSQGGQNFIVTDAHLLESVDQEIENSFRKYYNRIAEFRAILYEMSKNTITARQYNIYRDNYLYRTISTLPSLAKLLVSVVNQDPIDRNALNLVEKTFYEESGEGGRRPIHLDMLIESHNTHGSQIFNIAPISRQSVGESPNILTSARQLRSVQASLYSSNCYVKALGVFLAQEGVAESMLKMFYETFFEPYLGHYEGSLLKKRRVTQYFSSHLNGIEKEHAARAKHCALKACHNKRDAATLLNSMDQFLDSQANLWEALGKEFELSNVGGSGEATSHLS